MKTAETKLTSVRNITALLKNGKVGANIVYKKTQKIVISLRDTRNINKLRLNQQIVNGYSDLHTMLIFHNGNRIEIDNAVDIKGVSNEFLIFFDFTKEQCEVKYGIFERSLWLKEIPYVERNVIFQARDEEKIKESFNVIENFKVELELDYPNFFESEYFEIDNNELVKEINNGNYNFDKLKRNKKLKYLIKFSKDTSPIYDTLVYLNNKFDLSNSSDLWMILIRKYWDLEVKYFNSKERSEYFKQVEKFFFKSKEYPKYFEVLKTDQIKQKVEDF